MTSPLDAEPRVTGVVVAHNSVEVLEECLSALSCEGIPAIVVDSGSSDGSAMLVERRFPAVELVRTPNIGFGSACNLGISRCTSEFILVLNADAWPLAGAVSRLAAAARDPAVAVAGPRLVSPEGRPQRTVIGQPVRIPELVAWTLLPCATRATYLLSRRFRRSRTNDVSGREFLMGAALLLRRAALDEVCGFDSDFFMYDEDVDLCHRLVRAGWAVRYVPDATFVHVGEASSRGVAREMLREQLRSHVRFIAKHRGTRAATRARISLGLALRLRALVERGPRHASYTAAARWLLGTETAALLRMEEHR